MPISWNEIKHRAVQFSREWEGEGRERAEAKSFWDEFFQVFGIRRRTVASFEEPVKKLTGHWGYIDLFWPGTLIVEHKSAGERLDKAGSQAMQYIRGLVDSGRGEEVPRYVIVSDFDRIALHDLEDEIAVNFPLRDLYNYVHAFAFIPGYKLHRLDADDPINIGAVVILGELHDALEVGGYSGHDLERFLVRILFCLFADKTGIFDRDAFALYLTNRTAADGSDLGSRLAHLFEVLNTPTGRRLKNLDEDLAAFPYVNGALFDEHLGFAGFDRPMRDALLRCTRFDWGQISPAVFGSLFQSVMDAKERRRIGAHYTSERDIMKVVRSLFLDKLHADFRAIDADRSTRRETRLREFHSQLGRLRFLDPACGCGNFLVVAYRELRLLEIEVLRALDPDRQRAFDIEHLSLVDVDAMYGIEYEEWPARIAEVALWLMDHQMNLRLSEAFSSYFARLPLRKSPTIIQGNALRLDWRNVLQPDQCSYVLGNPPFVGAKYQSAEQRADMAVVAGGVAGFGLLDYVAGWYFKAADYIQGTPITVGFVSTNSITQGEQVGVLWNGVFARHRLKIHFAHRTFAWESEARGAAHVHVVIIGFGTSEADQKKIYSYEFNDGRVAETPAKNINLYLVDGPDVAITNRRQPICAAPAIGIGNKPIDDGNYLFTPEEKAEFLRREPAAAAYMRRWFGSREFINSDERWCLWLGECPPDQLRKMPEAMKRVEAVRNFRAASPSAPTRKLAETPRRFHVENIPTRPYLLIPKVSSERRKYIPMGFMPAEFLASDLCFIAQEASHYHFGVLSSAMHMAWVRQVCGRLKSDYRYSANLVYNNYPWPTEATEKQRSAVAEKARAVLEARAEFPDASLADLYDALAMPVRLVKAHAELDRAVDLCYRPQPFSVDRLRVEYLFTHYEQLTAPLAPAAAPRRPRPR